MNKRYDLIVIGLGPAGMAVSAMAAEMGLSVCAIEKRALGGECMNVGCIPSKALLSIGRARFQVGQLDAKALSSVPLPKVVDPFKKIRSDVDFIGTAKTAKMLDKVHLVLGQGPAKFLDRHTVQAGGQRYTAKRIYICVGTRPAIPPIPGIQDVAVLTNENMFNLEAIPESLTIIGGGAIGCEMAQAFTHLGCRCTIVQMDPHLLPAGERDLGDTLEGVFKKEGITVYNSRAISRIEPREGQVALLTEQGEVIVSERLLVAAGRAQVLADLDLEKAGVAFTKKGITVDNYLRTSQPNVYGVGDCNGYALLTHAAMHQGMLALMNSMIPSPFKMNFKKYVIPWTVFTTPEVSRVGKRRVDLDEEGLRYEEVTARYEDYGAAIAENIAAGYVKAYISPTGRILGAAIVGDGSGEMIGEWALAIQKKLRLTDIMMLQHSFPTMSFLTKRVSEIWMMGKMKSWTIQKIGRWMFG